VKTDILLNEDCKSCNVLVFEVVKRVGKKYNIYCGCSDISNRKIVRCFLEDGYEISVALVTCSGYVRSSKMNSQDVSF
jgi:hypothetical protein